VPILKEQAPLSIGTIQKEKLKFGILKTLFAASKLRLALRNNPPQLRDWLSFTLLGLE
jgi:hypothetical protein